MKIYELVYLISPQLETEETKMLASEINAFLQKEGGIVIKDENPSPKTLSYQIKNQGAAFQAIVEFSLDPEKLGVVEEKIRKEPRVLRYLIVIKKPLKEKQRGRKITKTLKEKPSFTKTTEDKAEKKVELKDIEEKLEEILKE